MEQTRILVLSSFALLREGLCALLGGHPRLQVVGEAPGWELVRQRVSRTRPHVVVLDVPQVDATYEVLIRRLKEAPQVPAIVVLSRQDDEATWLWLLRSGVQACLCETTGCADLVNAIEAVVAGTSFLCPAASRALLQAYRRRTRSQVKNDV